MADTKRLYDERTKKPGEAVTYEIPWWLYLGHTWRPGERFVTTTYVRPSRPNGFGETGITVANPQTDAIKQLSSARVSAGTAGQTYFITCTIVTTGGDTYIFTLKLSVE